MTKKSKKQPQGGDTGSPGYHFRLFVAGDEPNSAIAKASLDRICVEYLEQDCRVDVIDVLEDFRPALEEKVLVTPALVILAPGRRVVIFGNLSDTKKVLDALQIGSESV
jgi:circadian clock protein KaiB